LLHGFCKGLPSRDGLEGGKYLSILNLKTKKYLALSRMWDDGKFSVSPDGSIYYGTVLGTINVIDCRKREERVVVKMSPFAINPACSPNGKSIVFEGKTRDVRGIRDIIKADSDGRNVVGLTNGRAFCGSPCWSPDGRNLAYDMTVSGGKFSVWTMAADGRDQKPLVVIDGSNVQRPAWSPNGKWIAFQNDRDGNYSIYAVELSRDLRPKRIVEVAKDGFENKNPSWSADGRKIFYQSKRPAETLFGLLVWDFDLFEKDFDPNFPSDPVMISKNYFDEELPAAYPLPIKDGSIDLLDYLLPGITLISDSTAGGI